MTEEFKVYVTLPNGDKLHPRFIMAEDFKAASEIMSKRHPGSKIRVIFVTPAPPGGVSPEKVAFSASPTGECKLCKVAFEKRTSRQIFCSAKCRRKSYWADKIPAGFGDCRTCGTKFEKRNYRQIYCTPKCRPTPKRRTEPRVYKPRPCATCEKEFTPKAKTQIYCSKECQKTRHGNEKVPLGFTDCRTCGTSFMKTTANSIYCSKRCSWTFHNTKNRVTTTLPEKPCAVCGENFTPKTVRNIYCGYKCQQTMSTRRRMKEYHKKNPPKVKTPPKRREKSVKREKKKRKSKKPRGPRKRNNPPRPCSICGVVFTPRSSVNHFCSKACNREGRRRRTKENYVVRPWDKSPRECPTCSEMFTPVIHNQKYCRESCKVKEYNRLYLLRRAEREG